MARRHRQHAGRVRSNGVAFYDALEVNGSAVKVLGEGSRGRQHLPLWPALNPCCRTRLLPRLAIGIVPPTQQHSKMARDKNSKNDLKGNDSGLNFEAQLWAAAGQAVPAPTCGGVRLCRTPINSRWDAHFPWWGAERGISRSASTGDLRRLGSGKGNSSETMARRGPSERARVSHWARVGCRIQRNADSFRIATPTTLD
jgi:hypothetical protein